MFTRADYEQYFGEIARVERKMIYRSYDLCLELDEPVLVQAMRKIGDDEIRHYGLVLNMLRHINDPERTEKRLDTREYALGLISMKGPEGHTGEVRAYCVNISQGGICLECGQELEIGKIWHLEVKLFDQEEPLVRRAKAVWRKKVEAGLFMAGFQFLK